MQHICTTCNMSPRHATCHPDMPQPRLTTSQLPIRGMTKDTQRVTQTCNTPARRATCHRETQHATCNHGERRAARAPASPQRATCLHHLQHATATYMMAPRPAAHNRNHSKQQAASAVAAPAKPAAAATPAKAAAPRKARQQCFSSRMPTQSKHQ
jgi:hypothetical protein